MKKRGTAQREKLSIINEAFHPPLYWLKGHAEACMAITKMAATHLKISGPGILPLCCCIKLIHTYSGFETEAILSKLLSRKKYILYIATF